MRVWLEWIAPVFLLTTALFFLWRDTTPRAAEGLHRITAAQWLHEGAPEPKPVRLPHSLGVPLDELEALWQRVKQAERD